MTGGADAAAALVEAVSALLDAMQHAHGCPEPPLVWLSPWSAAADATASLQPQCRANLASVLQPCAARLAVLAGMRASRPADDAIREDIADGVRDATAVVGIQAMLPSLSETLHAAVTTGDVRRAEGAAFAAAAVARQVAATENTCAASLCASAVALLRSGDRDAAHSAVALIGALGAWLASAPPDAAAAAAAAFHAAVSCDDATLARAGAVAFMRAVDAGGAPAMAAAGGESVRALAALLVAGGPAAPHPDTLRPGQEPARTILLRALLRFAECSGGVAASVYWAELAAPPLRELQAALDAVQAHSTDGAACTALCRALRDARALLESAQCSDAAVTAALMPPLWPLLSAAAAVRTQQGEEDIAFELSGAFWTLLSPVQGHKAGAELSEAVLRAVVDAFVATRAPPYLALLQRCVEQGACGGSAAAEAAAAAASAALRGGDTHDAPLLRLLVACVRCRAIAFGTDDGIAALVQASTSSCDSTAGDDARAACELATALLCAPFYAGGDDASTSAFTAAAARLLRPRGCVQLCRALLAAANGAMPPDCVSCVSDALHAAWCAAGDAEFAGWLRAALVGDASFPRAGVSDELKAAFIASLVQDVNRRDARRFKRVVKSFCGGKKKSAGAAADTPQHA